STCRHWAGPPPPPRDGQQRTPLRTTPPLGGPRGLPPSLGQGYSCSPANCRGSWPTAWCARKRQARQLLGVGHVGGQLGPYGLGLGDDLVVPPGPAAPFDRDGIAEDDVDQAATRRQLPGALSRLPGAE